MQGDNLSAFDDIVKTYGNHHSFETNSTYSNEYKGINFIFTDSNLSRDHRAAGKIDIEAVKAEVKPDKGIYYFAIMHFLMVMVTLTIQLQIVLWLLIS